MSIRVCAGRYGSRRLECPVKGVRPTTDRVKQAIFSTLPVDLEGAHVLDLFAGSGNLGIEALSRGAGHVTFVDSSKVCTQVIEKNLRLLQALDQAKIVRSGVEAFLEKCQDQFDVIFMDPPYNKGLASQLAPHVYSFVKTGGVLVIEHSPIEAVPVEPWKTRTYGDTMITYITRDA
ncbi:MAG TPA: 16S rRNA (guanine(966)-N(2))-methyltransferase RsmD [Deltaproteobacteria bacterium]|nr:16S rRNA (guanine(966)-N(2))-methyltransferase RsmD [Deltaproteobacteria bacterium]HOI06609.1 16S rRNA (guanine(966)-N(2))-methyltransferase RsmD [Deltaproteobacteria bacterium]